MRYITLIIWIIIFPAYNIKAVFEFSELNPTETDSDKNASTQKHEYERKTDPSAECFCPMSKLFSQYILQIVFVVKELRRTFYDRRCK
jgi:hypothetical protein